MKKTNNTLIVVKKRFKISKIQNYQSNCDNPSMIFMYE